jgi:hypothetical protein
MDSSEMATRAHQTSPNPIHLVSGICSAKYQTPRPNCITGAMYCSSPSQVRGRRLAAAPNSSSGAAVTKPVEARRAKWSGPWDNAVSRPEPCAQARNTTAGTTRTAASTPRLSSGGMPTVFFSSP